MFPMCAGFKGMRGLWGGEAWHHLEGSELLRRAQERLSVKVQPSCQRDSESETSVPWTRSPTTVVREEEPQLWSGIGLSRADKLCAAEDGAGEVAQALRSPENREWAGGIRCCRLYLLDFGLSLIWL